MVTTNRMVGTDGHIPILDDIYSESSTQKAPLGTRMAWADGRVYKYFQNGGVALVAGKIVQTAVYVTGWDTSCHVRAAVVGATQIGAACTAGTSVVDTNIEVTALVDGFMGVKLGTGLGLQYQIKNHTTISSNGAFTMNLYDPVKVAIASAATCALTRNPYKDVVISATTPTGAIVGVAVIASTVDYYGWLQTWGIGMGISDLAVVQGSGIERSIGTAGYIKAMSTTAAATHKCQLGDAIGVGAANIYFPVMWKISP